MIKIYADLHRDEKFIYIEDKISQHDMSCMKKDDLKIFVDDFIKRYGEIHTCYDRFVNRVGYFIRKYGKRWYGQEFVVYTVALGSWGKETKRKEKHKYGTDGRLEKWPIGYFD